MLIPLYGFLEGDTLGLLVLAQSTDTIGSLAEKLEGMAAVRIAPRGGLTVASGGRVLPNKVTVREAGLTALDRIDVRRVESP